MPKFFTTSPPKDKEIVVKAVTKAKYLIKGNLHMTASRFMKETLKARREWHDVSNRGFKPSTALDYH